jgi:hypothetical protein
MKHAPIFEPSKVRNAMKSMQIETVEGHRKAGEQGLSNREGLSFQLQNSERVIVWPAHMSEARFLPMPRWEDRPKE